MTTEKTSLTKSEKISLSTKEIAKRIRVQLKEEFPECKFSVVTDYYSMGSSITVALMVADRKIKLRFEEIPERAFGDYESRHYTADELKRAQTRDYHQLGRFYDEYKSYSWSNGVFLTYQGYKLLKRVTQIADQYNYDDSDIQTDYYSVHFSFSLHLGKYDKPFVDGVGFKADPELEIRIQRRRAEVEVEVAEAKMEQMLRDAKYQTTAFKEKMKALHIEDIKRCSAVIDGRGFVDLRSEEAKQAEIDRVLIDEKKYFPTVKPTDWKTFTLEL
jgi:hypothetical protein